MIILGSELPQNDSKGELQKLGCEIEKKHGGDSISKYMY